MGVARVYFEKLFHFIIWVGYSPPFFVQLLCSRATSDLCPIRFSAGFFGMCRDLVGLIETGIKF